MSESRKYCMGCMKPLDDNVTVCPECYYKTETQNNSPALPAGTILSGRYLIGKVISIANDSITYISRDLYSDTVLSIAEFFPVKLLSRESGETNVMVKLGYDTMFENCRDSFLSLWRALSMFKDVCLPDVQDIIESNGTVYAISKYLDSISLKAYFEETKKPLSWARAHSAFKPVLACLKRLHSAGIVHGAISPNTVHVGSDGKLHLKAFSIPQCRSSVEELRAKPASGFAPIELYGENAQADSTSDVYSVMALIYYAITGLVPPKATDRANQDTMILPAAVAATLSDKVIDCFVKSLSVYPQNRIRSVDEIIAILSPSAAPKSTPKAAAPQQHTVTDDTEAYESKEDDDEPAPKNKANKKGNDKSLVMIGLTTFLAVVMLCSVLFCGLYVTVLYKSVDIPVLNSLFSSFSFLPINKEVTDVYVPQQSDTTTTNVSTPEKSYVTVPDFTSHTRDSITTNTNFNEKFVIVFAEDYSDTVAKDSIIRQNVEKGESVISGTEIIVTVSLGPKPIELPNVIGMKYNEAKKELESRGFVVTKEVMENDGDNVYDEVYVMSKVAGLEFEKGTEIVLSVWDKAPEKETTTKEDKKDKNKETTNKAETNPEVTKKSDE